MFNSHAVTVTQDIAYSMVSQTATCTTAGMPTIVHWYTALIKSQNTKKL
jgi:hypothetical protein